MAELLNDQSDRATAFQYEASSTPKQYRNVPKLTLIIIGLCLGPSYFGCCLVYFSSIPDSTLQRTFGSDSTKPAVYGVLVGCITIGAAIGSLVAQVLIRYFSRKNFLILMDLTAIVIGVVIQYPNLYVLLVMRLFQGILVGNYMALVPIYINEIAPKQILGSFGVFTQLLVVGSVLITYIVGMVFVLVDSTGEFMWRFMFAFNLIPVLTQLVLFFTGFIPESPISLMMKGKEEEAREVLLMFNTQKVIEEVIIEKRKELTTNQPNDGEQKIQMTPISLFLGFQLPFMQQISGIIMITTQVSKLIPNSSSITLYVPIIINAVQFIATGFAVFALSKWGRKPLILLGNIILGLIDISIGILFLFSDWPPSIDIILVFIALFMLFYGVTVGPIIWLYVPEIIPSKIVPGATFMNWLGGSICSTITPVIADVVGSPYPLFFLFGGISVVLFVFNVNWVVQTKGLSVSEINKKFKK